MIPTADGPPCMDMPACHDGERPLAYADRVGQWHAARTTARRRKAQGLFLTPASIADFMDRQAIAEGSKVRILDPAAGAGILCCAAVEALAAHRPKPEAIELVAYEVDGGLVASLRAVLGHLASWCRERHGVAVDFGVEAADFIMANAGHGLDCPAGNIHVSAFPDFKEFRKHMANIAWETRAWRRDAPEHMIHFNGDRFLGPRK